MTFHVLPRHNPDGWAPTDDNETPTRANGRPEDACHDGPYFGEEQCGPVDPNRQHYFGINPALLADVVITTEDIPSIETSEVQTSFEPQWVHEAVDPYTKESEFLVDSDED